MHYFRIAKENKYDSQKVAKLHIMDTNSHMYCGIKISPKHKEVIPAELDEICGKCKAKTGISPTNKQETLKRFIVRHIEKYTIDSDSDAFLVTLERACKDIENSLITYSAKCTTELDICFPEKISGKIVIQVDSLIVYILFTYKSNRKDKLHFESASRHYLTLPVNFVFNSKLNAGAFL